MLCAVPTPMRMRSSDLALVRGIGPTRTTLRAWNRAPWPVLRRWLTGSAAVAVALLLATWAVAARSTPAADPMLMPGLNEPTSLAHVGVVLWRNGLVLALHAFACVAGFLAGSALPRESARYGRFWRAVHDRTGTLAIAFVGAATAFSLLTQAYALGRGASTLAAQLGMPVPLLVVGLLPHAFPELVALFLPLAAWLVASRRGRWEELLAATVVTVALAVPVLVASAVVETYVSPRLITVLQFV